MGRAVILTVIIITAISGYWLYTNMHMDEKHVEITGGERGEPYYGIVKGKGKDLVHFDLVDPECAPEDMLSKILYGYHIMLDTKEHTPDYCLNTLSCNNCHFNAGNTLGGKNRGISLVGVSAMYPRFSKRDNKDITLADRLDNCYKRSMNGKPLPPNSLEKEAIIAYLAWISNEVMDAPRLPWLGVGQLTSKHEGDPVNGEKVYIANCAICHGHDGLGAPGVPPLWGDNSFNDGAGMNVPAMMASFVWLNMPYGQPTLSQEDAIDVALYVTKQPRPHFVP